MKEFLQNTVSDHLMVVMVFALIFVQVPHNYYVFSKFSKLKKGKSFQSWVFCGIFSLLILYGVIIENEFIAISGAILEMLINVYYYNEQFFVGGFPNSIKRSRKQQMLRYWRQNGITMILFTFVFPSAIYVIAHIFINE